MAGCNPVETISTANAEKLEGNHAIYNGDTPRPCWSEILASFREEQCRENGVPSDDKEVFRYYEKYREFFPSVHRQLSLYGDRLRARRPADATNDSKEDKRNLIVDTRNALRFAMSCLSISCPSSEDQNTGDGESDRQLMQREAIRCEWDKPVASILCCRGRPRKGDDKCRLYASRVLCNLVTSNAETASRVTSWLQLTPSEDTIARRILNGSLELQQQHEGEGADDDIEEIEPNWLDMILSSARDRDTLAAILGAMHNSLASLDRQHSNNDDSSFANQISSNSLLISTLLRQTVSLESAKKNILNKDNNSREEAEEEVVVEANLLSDEATEWIVLLIGRLSRYGNLPAMYNAIAGTDNTEGPTTQSVILPEQLVLLHCLQASITSDTGDKNIINLWEAEHVTALSFFLVDLYTNLRQISTDDNSKSSTAEVYDDNSLRDRAILIILEILAELVGSSSSSPPSPSALTAILEEEEGDDATEIQDGMSTATIAARLRVKIGQETNFIETIGLHAGELVDGIMRVYKNGKIVPGNENENKWKNEGPVLIVLVRLFGYLSYHCRPNQDLLRTVEVPVEGQLENPPTTNSEGSATSPPHRSILHVLLSCTSLSFVCFPLREWSIVTLRLVLQDNNENQAIVESLQAQQAVQTATLDEMGMNVQLDQYGKVKLTPKKNEER